MHLRSTLTSSLVFLGSNVLYFTNLSPKCKTANFLASHNLCLSLFLVPHPFLLDTEDKQFCYAAVLQVAASAPVATMTRHFLFLSAACPRVRSWEVHGTAVTWLPRPMLLTAILTN